MTPSRHMFRTAEDYRDHLPCPVCEQRRYAAGDHPSICGEGYYWTRPIFRWSTTEEWHPVWVHTAGRYDDLESVGDPFGPPNEGPPVLLVWRFGLECPERLIDLGECEWRIMESP